ncbi:MAG: hypothetical protein ABJA83_03455 [Burkholderiaceae bacterium]
MQVQAATRTVDFSGDVVGQPPKGFEFFHTKKIGVPGKWMIETDGTEKYLTQLEADRTSIRFLIAALTDVSAADVDLSVRFKPVAGRIDRAAGLVWRFQNEDNYYLVRANALENNVVLYKVEGGNRVDLPVKGEGRTYGKRAEVPAGKWSTLRVVARGALFEVHLNSVKLFEVEDKTFSQAGRVGVWTKADSVTSFADLKVVTP